MSNDQFSPLTGFDENEIKSLGDSFKCFINYYYFFKKIIIDNNREIMGERFFTSLLKMISKEDGKRFLEYLADREAYTINVASYQLNIESNKLYQYTVAFMNMGVITKHGKLGAGERGSPTLLYALRDASQSRIDAAAQLYKDITSSHVNSLDEYLKDYDYTKAAEEVIANHLLPDGSVSSYAITRILVRMNLDHDKHRDNVRHILQSMGYNIRQGE